MLIKDSDAHADRIAKEEPAKRLLWCFTIIFTRLVKKK